ncbi:MAG: MscL family protein [Candidatus Aenigmarchaeota archaeon]|nr:MscL family protein [Candidatus Aenigmarchaeota archaeon]
MGFFKEFMDFMIEQKIIAVALAFIVGIATATLVQALVKDIITPMYSPYLSFLDPKAEITIGASKFLIGDFIMQLINWIVILLVVFIIGKKIAKT